jgi:hypothetical protein
VDANRSVNTGVQIYELRYKYPSPCDEIIVPSRITRDYFVSEDAKDEIRRIILSASKESCQKIYSDLQGVPKNWRTGLEACISGTIPN